MGALTQNPKLKPSGTVKSLPGQMSPSRIPMYPSGIPILLQVPGQKRIMLSLPTLPILLELKGSKATNIL